MTDLVVMLVVFVAVGILFLFVNLLVGQLVRPNQPTTTKGEIYDCGEQAVGTAEVQFDLRFYVVALLFVIFDVEIAFLFPWATVFGSATRAGNAQLTESEREQALAQLNAGPETTNAGLNQFATFAALELAFFFGLLLVGFAYLWRRGDLDWVRSMASQPNVNQNLRPQEIPTSR